MLDNDLKTCVVLVTNRRFLRRCLATVWQVRLFGRYRGTIVVIVGNDLENYVPMLSKLALGISPRHFPDLDRSNPFLTAEFSAADDTKVVSKEFQFHKFHCFQTFFQKWDRVLYLDAGIKVFNHLAPLLHLDAKGCLIAHSDSFPDYQWTLEDQFSRGARDIAMNEIPEIAKREADYFQTTIMLYDTKIIEASTVEDLRKLSIRYPNSKTNDQGIINVWALPKGIWKKLPTARFGTRFLYDFVDRDPHSTEDYILLKYPKGSQRRARFVSEILFRVYWGLLWVRLQLRLPKEERAAKKSRTE